MKKFTQLLSLLLIAVFALTPVTTMNVSAKRDVKPTSISRLSAATKQVAVGKKFELRAYAGPKGFEDDYLRWKTSNKSIVAFEDHERDGDDMDFIAKKEGTAVITCYIPGTAVSKSCTVTVKGYKKPKITVDDKYMDVDKGEWEDIEAKLVGGNYSDRRLIYKVSNSRIKVKKGHVYGRKRGRAKITIYAKANKSIKKTVYVTVE